MAHTKANEEVPWKVPISLSATGTRSFGGLPPTGEYEVKRIQVCNSATITGDNTNHWLISFNKGTIASPTAITTLDLVTGVDLTANVPRNVSITAVTSALRRLATTDVLHVVCTKTSSPDALACDVIFWVIPVRDHGNEV